MVNRGNDSGMRDRAVDRLVQETSCLEVEADDKRNLARDCGRVLLLLMPGL